MRKSGYEKNLASTGSHTAFILVSVADRRASTRMGMEIAFLRINERKENIMCVREKKRKRERNTFVTIRRDESMSMMSMSVAAFMTGWG